jgi:hypothetical protein
MTHLIKSAPTCGQPWSKAQSKPCVVRPRARAGTLVVPSTDRFPHARSQLLGPLPPSLFRREGKPSIKGHHTRLLARVHAQSSPPRAPPCRLCCPSPSSPLHSLPEPSDHLGLLPRVHSSFHPHSLPSLASGFAEFRVATAAPPLPDHRPSSPEPPRSLLRPQRGH